MLFKEYVNKKIIKSFFFIIQLKQTNTEQKYKFIWKNNGALHKRRYFFLNFYQIAQSINLNFNFFSFIYCTSNQKVILNYWIDFDLTNLFTIYEKKGHMWMAIIFRTFVMNNLIIYLDESIFLIIKTYIKIYLFYEMNH